MKITWGFCCCVLYVFTGNNEYDEQQRIGSYRRTVAVRSRLQKSLDRAAAYLQDVGRFLYYGAPQPEVSFLLVEWAAELLNKRPQGMRQYYELTFNMTNTLMLGTPYLVSIRKTM